MVKSGFYVLIFSLMACGSGDSKSKDPVISPFRSCDGVENPLPGEFSSRSQLSIEATELGNFVAESDEIFMTFESGDGKREVNLKNGEIHCADGLTGFYSSVRVLTPVEFRLTSGGDSGVVTNAIMKVDVLELDGSMSIKHRSNILQPADISELGSVQSVTDFSIQQVSDLIEARSSLIESKWFMASNVENQSPSRYVLLQKNQSSGVIFWKRTVFIRKNEVDSNELKAIPTPSPLSSQPEVPTQSRQVQNPSTSLSECPESSNDETVKALIEAVESEIAQVTLWSGDQGASGFYLYQSQQIFVRTKHGASVQYLSFKDGDGDCALSSSEGLAFQEVIRTPHEFILVSADGHQPAVMAAGIREDILSKEAGDPRVLVLPGYLQTETPAGGFPDSTQAMLDRDETLAFLSHSHPVYQTNWFKLPKADNYGRSVYVLLQKSQSDHVAIWKRTIYAYSEERSFEVFPDLEEANKSPNAFRKFLLAIERFLGF